MKCVIFSKRSTFLSNTYRELISFFFQASDTDFFSVRRTFGLSLKYMGGISFKIDILMLDFYCHPFCLWAFQILHLFVSELWTYRKNVTIVAEH